MLEVTKKKKKKSTYNGCEKNGWKIELMDRWSREVYESGFVDIIYGIWGRLGYCPDTIMCEKNLINF